MQAAIVLQDIAERQRCVSAQLALPLRNDGHQALVPSGWLPMQARRDDP